MLHLLLLRTFHTDQRQQPNVALDARLACSIRRCHACRPKQLIHFLEGAAFRFRDEEINVEDGDGRDTPEENERAELGRADEGGRSSRDHEIVQLFRSAPSDQSSRAEAHAHAHAGAQVEMQTYPVTAPTNTNALGAHTQRKDLGRNDPSDGP